MSDLTDLVALVEETNTTTIHIMSRHAAVIHGCSDALARHLADGCDASEVRDVAAALDVLEVQALTIKAAIEKLTSKAAPDDAGVK